jgi:hypothetical protein
LLALQDGRDEATAARFAGADLMLFRKKRVIDKDLDRLWSSALVSSDIYEPGSATLRAIVTAQDAAEPET